MVGASTVGYLHNAVDELNLGLPEINAYRKRHVGEFVPGSVAISKLEKSLLRRCNISAVIYPFPHIPDANSKAVYQPAGLLGIFLQCLYKA